MASRHLSIRIDSDLSERLEAQSRRARQSRSKLAKVLLEEGLRMEAHPGIIFRSGPAGRRPGLAAGPDVWEVMRVFREGEAHGEDALGRAVALTGLGSDQIRTAVRYYVEYPTEIDDWIRRVDEDAERYEAAWRREQDLLRR